GPNRQAPLRLWLHRPGSGPDLFFKSGDFIASRRSTDVVSPDSLDQRGQPCLRVRYDADVRLAVATDLLLVSIELDQGLLARLPAGIYADYKAAPHDQDDVGMRRKLGHAEIVDRQGMTLGQRSPRVHRHRDGRLQHLGEL